MVKVWLIGFSKEFEREVEDSDLICLSKIKNKLISLNELIFQYSLFCKGVTGLQASVYSQAVESHYSTDKDQIFTSQRFIEAEYILTSHAVTFVKFVELYPSLLGKALANLEHRTWAKNEINSIYDNSESYYSFLNELRHAAVHNVVKFTVSRGVKRMDQVKGVSHTFGYFLDLQSFLERGVRKNKKKFIAPKSKFLTNKRGCVDLVKAFTDCSNEIYLKLILPKEPALKEYFNLLELEVKEIFNKYSIPFDQQPTTTGFISIQSSGDQPIFDMMILFRTKQLILNLIKPPIATFISISPSNID